MHIMQFSEIQQLVRDYWWLPLCPGAALWFLPPVMRVIAAVSAIIAIAWAVRHGKPAATNKQEPIVAEVVKEAA